MEAKIITREVLAKSMSANFNRIILPSAGSLRNPADIVAYEE